MDYLLVFILGIAAGAIFFKKSSRQKATEAIKEALNKETE